MRQDNPKPSSDLRTLLYSYRSTGLGEFVCSGYTSRRWYRMAFCISTQKGQFKTSTLKFKSSCWQLTTPLHASVPLIASSMHPSHLHAWRCAALRSACACSFSPHIFSSHYNILIGGGQRSKDRGTEADFQLPHKSTRDRLNYRLS
jgi:hypothetical protein